MNGPIHRVVLLSKISFLEEVRRGLVSSDVASLATDDEKIILADREHRSAIDVIQEQLSQSQYGLDVRLVEALSEHDVEWADLVISAGGDGTFLRAARRFKADSRVPLLGVNSSPSSSFGFFCATDYKHVSSLLDSVLQGMVLILFLLWPLFLGILDHRYGFVFGCF